MAYAKNLQLPLDQRTIATTSSGSRSNQTGRSSNDDDGRGSTRKVVRKKQPAGQASRTYAAPTYTVLPHAGTTHLAGLTASAAASTDSLGNPATPQRSTATSPSARVPSEHLGVAVRPPAQPAAGSQQVVAPTVLDSKSKGKSRASPATVSTTAAPPGQFVSRTVPLDIAEAVRNAGLTPPATMNAAGGGTGGSGAAVVNPSTAAGTAGGRDLRHRTSATAMLSIPDASSVRRDSAPSIHSQASASSASLAPSTASNSSRNSTAMAAPKQAKRKKKRKSPTAEQQTATSVSRLRAPEAGHGAGASFPVNRPRQHAEVTSQTVVAAPRGSPAQPQIRSEQSRRTTRAPNPAASSNVPIMQATTPTVGQGQTEQGRGSPPPPAWSPPKTTITLAFTPMHAYLAEYHDDDPFMAMQLQALEQAQNNLRLREQQRAAQQEREVLPPVPNSPPPGFRSRPPTPQEQAAAAVPGPSQPRQRAQSAVRDEHRSRAGTESDDYLSDVDVNAVETVDRGYASSENEQDLLSSQGRGLGAAPVAQPLDDDEARRLWQLRHWEAWRRQHVDLLQRWRRIQGGEDQDSDSVITLSRLAAQAAVLRQVLAQQEDTARQEHKERLAATSASRARSEVPPSLPRTGGSHVSSSTHLDQTEPISSLLQQDALPITSPSVKPAEEPISEASTATVAAPLPSPALSDGQSPSRFPGIGTVRRARLKRFDEQRKASMNLSSVIEGSAGTVAPSVPSPTSRRTPLPSPTAAPVERQLSFGPGRSVTGSTTTQATATGVTQPTLRAPPSGSPLALSARVAVNNPSTSAPVTQPVNDATTVLQKSSQDLQPGQVESPQVVPQAAGQMQRVLPLPIRRPTVPPQVTSDTSSTQAAHVPTSSTAVENVRPAPTARAPDVAEPPKLAQRLAAEVATRRQMSTASDSKPVVSSLSQTRITSNDSSMRQADSQSIEADNQRPSDAAPAPATQKLTARVSRLLRHKQSPGSSVTRNPEAGAANVQSVASVIKAGQVEDLRSEPILTLPKAPPRLTTDPLSSNNLRKLSRRRSSSNGSSSSGISDAEPASDSKPQALSDSDSDSDSDSADEESTVRKPPSSLRSFPSGVAQQRPHNGAFASVEEREAAAANWRRAEEGRRYSALLSRPLSIKRKPPPVPPKRWGRIWDSDSMPSQLVAGLRSVGEDSDEADHAVPSQLPRTAGYHAFLNKNALPELEEEPDWEVVGENAKPLDDHQPYWPTIGREMNSDGPYRIPTGPRQPAPPAVHPYLIGQSQPSATSNENSRHYASIANDPESVSEYDTFLRDARPDVSPPRIRHISEPSTPSGARLQRSSAVRRRSSVASAAQQDAHGSVSTSPDNIPRISANTRASLSARPRHVYSTSLPTSSMEGISPSSSPPRFRRPLPMPPIESDDAETDHADYSNFQLLRPAPPPREPSLTDLDVAIANMDTAQPAAAQIVDEVLGLARPATADEIDSLPVGRVELERRRVDKTGKTKQKLSCVGIGVNKCAICLMQFKEDEMVAVLPECFHALHAEPCARSYFSSNHLCPSCGTPIV